MPRALPVEILTSDESDRARNLALKVGERDAAERLGVDRRTLARAIARLPVHRLTATTVRARLRRRMPSGI